MEQQYGDREDMRLEDRKRDTAQAHGRVRRLLRASPMSWLSRLIVLLIVLVVAGALTGVYFFITRANAIRLFLGGDRIFEITYQFLLVTIIGGAVALLYKQVERRREERRVLREMHAELLSAFNKAKGVRRRLRAGLGTIDSIDPGMMIAAEDYKEQMELLSDAQLTFETYRKRAEGRSLWFWGGKRLAKPLGKVEEYLNSIVKEYERELSKFMGNPPAQRIANLTKLTEFIGPHKDAKAFRCCFQYPNREVLDELGNVVLR